MALAEMSPPSCDPREKRGGEASGFGLQTGELYPPDVIEEHAAAVAALPDYPVKVVKRSSMADPVSTPRATFYEERVRFSDHAVRTLTFAVPNERWHGRENIIPHPVNSTDALGTGPDGFNHDIIESFANDGWLVVWLHHQGRHSERPTSIYKAARVAQFIFNKSVGRSAHHQHVLLDDLSEHSHTMDPSSIFWVGDSRSAMTGEAVSALGPKYKHIVRYDDLIGSCFEHKPQNTKEWLELASVPFREAGALGQLAWHRLIDGLAKGELDKALNLLGTLDPHFMNVLHELAWVPGLMNGEAGMYAKAVPLDAQGVRVVMPKEPMCQAEAWQQRHAVRKGIRFMLIEGAHITLAEAAVQRQRQDRLARLQKQAREHGFKWEALDFDEITQLPLSRAA